MSPLDSNVDGQINWHVCASYWHAKISYYPGLAPGFFFGAPGMARSAVTGAVRFTVVVSWTTRR